MRVDIVLDPNTRPETLGELGALAESYDLGAMWMANHVSARDPFMCFAEMARGTSKIRMGPIAVSPFELHPLKMANMLWTLNEFSNGRANIVVGGGGETMIAMHLKPTFESMHPKMVTGVRECIEFLKTSSPNRRVDFDGEVFQVSGYQPTWARHERPHLYVAATRPKMMRMAGEVADGLMTSDGTLPLIEQALPALNEGLVKSGRALDDFRFNNLYAWHVKKDKDKAVAEARRKLWVRGMLLPWYLEPFLGKADREAVQENMNAFMNAYFANSPVIEGVPDRLIDTLVENLTLTGGVAELDSLIDHLKKMTALGINEIALRIYDDPADAIRIIGERVAPAL
jgi:alkanesulfonate monooxygenase SsuD/methylene tetrahydromethanopterin reductase-like flavin-dependent oxidoreductase (luciferase family)